MTLEQLVSHCETTTCGKCEYFDECEESLDEIFPKHFENMIKSFHKNFDKIEVEE